MASLLNMSSSRLVGSKVLPYDAEIEYLESSGTQYIETELIPNGRDTICRIRCFHSSWGGVYFTNTTNWPSSYDYNNAYGGIFKLGRSNLSLSNDIGTINYYELGNMYIKDLVTGSILVDATPVTFVNTYPLRIFSTQNSCKDVRIYSISFLEGNDILADYIPVRKDGVGYMYDKVTGQLFGNAGTGAFILGPDKTN